LKVVPLGFKVSFVSDFLCPSQVQAVSFSSISVAAGTWVLLPNAQPYRAGQMQLRSI
jgi:hypothetical protein